MVEELTERVTVLLLFLVGVPLLALTITGLIVSTLQAATQIQDQTVGIVVKLLTLSVILTIFGGRMFLELSNFFSDCLILLAGVTAS